MAGISGVVSVTEATYEAVQALGGPVREAILDGLRGVLAHGTHIATDTGWHGQASQAWYDDFVARYDAMAASTAAQLDELVSWATSTFTAITGAGGGMA